MFSSNRKSVPVRRLLTAVILLGTNLPASALEYSLATTLAAKHSDNTLRSRDNEKNNFSLEPGLLLEAIHDGNTVQAALEYQFERRFHTEGRNLERNFLRGGARVDWQILPDRLDFELRQTSTESTQNVAQNGAPNDKVVNDYISFGPTLHFRLRGTDQLRFTYLYEDTDAAIDEDDFESDVFSGSYVFFATELSSLTAEHRQEDITYSSDIARDLDVTQQTLAYSYESNAGTTFLLSGGYSEYEREGADSVKGTIGELIWERTLGASTFNIYGRRHITNQSFRLTQDLGRTDLNDFTLFIDANIAEVFTETAYGVRYDQTVGATHFNIGVDVFSYDYEELRADRDEYNITVGAERKLNRNMSFNAAARYRSSDEDDIPGTLLSPAREGMNIRQYLIRGQLDWRFARNLDFSFGVEYNRSPGNFDETLTYVTASYNLIKRG